MSVIIVANLVAKAGQEELVEKTLLEAVPAVHDEPGCARYSLHRKKGTVGHFVMVEKWASENDLQSHRGGIAMAKVGKVLGDALAEAPSVVVLDALPAGDLDKGAL
ncbi:putative quinol monooxygenase [Streptomyces griseofuscus]|uniref:Antibiotic biosynthesis monooxygenase n=1 Tax=Streptomyces griseofuscus TaxID=146922 RepID=A0A426SD55_9ACTN|nr:putative quinol monooxygenase [Streptomyces griseofuscus]RRQ88710.1 antibiotic biosynthesis monooxygenase [Streptomyces griseofuscus]